MYQEHPTFNSISDESKIWRYMDLTKFMDLLENKNLFFCRADKFEDKFEGSLPKFNLENRKQVYKNLDDKLLNKIAHHRRQIVHNTYINCWHINEVESEAMWKLYAQCKEAIAIQSTFKNFKECFNESDKTIHIGKINYVDYNSYWVSERNSFEPFLHKRLSFLHENELRAIVQEFNSDERGIDLSKPLSNFGLNIPIKIETLICSIYVSPLSPPWFYELVKKITRSYDLNVDIFYSSLSDEPVF